MTDVLALLWERFTRELAQSSPLDFVVKLLATIVLLSLIYVAQWVLRRSWSWLRRTLPPWWDSCRRLARARSAVDECGPGIWLTIKQPTYPPRIVSSLADTGKLILSIANLKGGVGKTTLAANLAAYFANPFDDANRLKRRVLVIDLDFQGSCSSMLFAGMDWQPSESRLSDASALISGTVNSNYLGEIGRSVAGVNRARGISAFYDLARIENREMVRWLIGDATDDIRYRLAALLFTKSIMGKAIVDEFDVIIMDAPPRLTTATIQALCASTHVLIPTILDALSGDAVGYFGRQLVAHEDLWPHLKVLGLVGTMTNRQRESSEAAALRSAGDRLRAALEGSRSSLRHVQEKGVDLEFPYPCSVFERASLSRAAGHGIAYVSDVARDRNEAHEVFNPFGAEVQARWPL